MTAHTAMQISPPYEKNKTEKSSKNVQSYRQHLTTNSYTLSVKPKLMHMQHKLESTMHMT